MIRLTLSICIGLVVHISSWSPAAPPPAGAGRMIQQLQSESWIEQAEALHYLGEYRVEMAATAVGALLESQTVHPWTRGQALLSLSHIKGKVDPTVFGKWVAHEHPAIRSSAAEVLETYGGNSAVTWIKILLKDPDLSVRCHAAAAHAKRNKAAAWNVVDPLTLDPAISTARASARALAFTGTAEAYARLTTQISQPGLMRESLRGIRSIEDPQLIPILLNLLPNLEETHLNYGMILTALQNQEWKAVTSGLTAFIQSGNEQKVKTGARLITTLTRSPELGAPLRVALSQATQIETIEAGLIALGSAIMNPDEHEEFFRSKLKHEQPSIRSLSIRCLAHCKEINHYEVLRESLDDSNHEVVEAALGALKRQPAVNAPKGQLVSYLETPLSSNNESIRALAYEVLAHAGSEADFRPAMAALEELLTGTDEILR